jgi:hypothetical protein
VSGEFQAFKLTKDESIAGHSFRYLEVLCRELANHMAKRDPDYFLKTYDRWQEEYDRIGELSASEMKDRLRVISSEIPTYEEFDLVGVRDFIDVDRELMDRDIEEIAEHYRKIKSWIALLSRTDDEWRYASGWRFGDEKFQSGIDEYEVLTKEIRRQENVSAALQMWASKHGIGLEYIQPGKPQQNAYVERYNRTVRHEWLGQYIFETIKEAQDHATRWLWTYNNERPTWPSAALHPL